MKGINSLTHRFFNHFKMDRLSKEKNFQVKDLRIKSCTYRILKNVLQRRFTLDFAKPKLLLVNSRSKVCASQIQSKSVQDFLYDRVQ